MVTKEEIKDIMTNGIEIKETVKLTKEEKEEYVKDKSLWTTKCGECGKKMVYVDSEYDPRYYCKYCGNVLEV